MSKQLISLKQKLDKNQLQAVQHGEGPLLITAGPGSGKTTVITHHIQYLMQELEVLPKQILVITFTKSAATEMKQRFLNLIGEQETEVAFGTFHAFFYQILRQSGGFSHNSFIEDKDKYKILKKILNAEKIYFHENTFLEDILNEISMVKNKGKTEGFRSAYLEPPVFDKVFREYTDCMRAIGKIDFDDMVIFCYELLKSRKDILREWQERFHFVLLDEFQDINPMQYEIVKLLAEKHHNLFAVGDEDQSIYSFRGANPEIAFRFLKDYPEAKQVFLSVNYRCHKEIVEKAKNLISHNKNRFEKDMKGIERKHNIFQEKAIKDLREGTNKKYTFCRSFAEPINVNFAENEIEEYQILAEHVKEYGARRGYEDCAILLRTNMISPLLLQCLKENEIPYEIKGKKKNWAEHFVIRDIKAYFALAKGNLRRSYFYQIMNKPVRFFSRELVDRDTFTWEEIETKISERNYLKDEYVLLRKHLKRIGELPVFAAIQYIVHVAGYDKWLCSQAVFVQKEGETVLELLRFLAKRCDTEEELWEQFEDNAQRNINHKEQNINNKVVLMTYHAAKGLEWSCVFLPDLINGNTPYRRAEEEKDLEEERRMFYVAFTRAKNQVFLYSLRMDEQHKKYPSVYLKELKYT